jgi:hypothetical protein
MATGFPAELNHVPVTDRVPEAFGWMPSLVGGTLLFQSAFLLPTSPPVDLYGISVGLSVLGALLLYFEVRRRRYRTVLVPPDEVVGIYRKRTFVQAITVGEVTPYLLSSGNTFQFLLIPVLMTGLFLFLSAVPPSQREVSTEERLGWLVAGLLMLAASASLTRTRILCAYFKLPAGRGQEEILLPRADVTRVFPTLR